MARTVWTAIFWFGIRYNLGNRCSTWSRSSSVCCCSLRARATPVAFEIVVNQRPAWVTIDPYYKLIDRDRGDNGRAVLSAGAQASR